ncbi:response regulator [Rhodanobacter sp. A1T4]|jgi:two-component system response regulator BaeR|uniref:response regulator n=1 Tax=Rhodanobacter sp. A1T4 TaxID=2723087 RepID=UPI0016168B71|nr:response regulator [Rhodanobacter sp. A1T4]MBB6246517.1 two-component system response regulator BaeR [Rhodanobacter sp. A1T4]
MTTTQYILIAEDEPKIAALLSEYLQDAGYLASIVDEGDRVLQAIGDHQPDLLLLDVMLPGKDGLQILRELRKDNPLPVIMLTARVEEIDRLLGLEFGADDYVCKPFSPREVVARVRALLRRTSGSVPINPFVVDESMQRILVAGKPLPLTTTEYRLLQTLVAHPGRVYSRDQLLDLMHDELRDVTDRVVDSHIRNLRRKLDDLVPGGPYIHSVYGAGYRFESSEAASP